MIRKNWRPLLLIVCFVIAFFGYRYYDALHTDTENPTISMDASQLLQVSVKDPKSALLQGVTAQDRQDGDISAKLIVEGMQLIDTDGLLEVTYAVADSSGNVAKATRQVLYTDYESPKFSLDIPLIYPELSDPDIMSPVGAWDVVDGDIQHRIRATSLTESRVVGVGIHNVHFQVTNSLGDTSEIVLPVEIVETGSYDADLTLKETLIYIPQGAKFQPNSYLNSFTYRTEEVSLRYGLPEGFSLKTTGEVNTQTPGVYPVGYTVTYTIRHDTNSELDQKIVGYSKLIVVVEG